MASMMAALRQYLHEILTLLGDDNRKLPGLVFLFLGLSFMDLVGLGLIAPYIGLVMNQLVLELGYLVISFSGLVWTPKRRRCCKA